jgi:hypothetical protein
VHLTQNILIANDKARSRGLSIDQSPWMGIAPSRLPPQDDGSTDAVTVAVRQRSFEFFESSTLARPSDGRWTGQAYFMYKRGDTRSARARAHLLR